MILGVGAVVGLLDIAVVLPRRGIGQIGQAPAGWYSTLVAPAMGTA